MDIIHNKENGVIKEAKKLKEKKYRIQKNKFMIEGFRFCEEALLSNFDVEEIFISKDSEDKWKSFGIESKLQKNTKVFWVTDSILKSLSSTETPQGIVGVINRKNVDNVDKRGFYVLVDKVQDPGNLGTIIRTAHAAGALGVILTKGTVDVYNEKTLRSTMGSIFHVPIIVDEENKNLNELKKKGFKLIVSSLDAEKNFFQAELKDKIIIAVGNEGNGVSNEIFDLADIKVKIPMPGGAESLNVSIAASIMMFEAVRQNY